MKKTIQILLLVICSQLLLVSGSVNAHAQTATPQEFTGVWDTVTSKGKKIRITLEQVRVGTVTGTYAPNALSLSYRQSEGAGFGFVKVSASMAEPVFQGMSSIRGRLKDNVLRFYWNEDGGRGAGRFTLSADGNSFEGTLSGNDNPDDTSGGSWNGTRLHSFAGAWQGTIGNTHLMLILQQSGDQVTGQVKVNSGDLGMVREGKVVGDTFRFKIIRPGQRVPNTTLPDQFMGTGELVMDASRKSFKGTILNSPASAAFLGR